MQDPLLTPHTMPTENETEISFFSRELYDSFLLNPEVSLLVDPLATSLGLILVQTKWES